MALPIIWNISRFEGDYEEYHEEFKTDRENINVALAQVQSLDTPASPAEIETLASQVPQVECQDDLSQSLEARAIALCKCRPGVAPIRFRAHDTWPGPAFQNVTRMFVDMPNGLLKHDSSTQTDNQGWPKILDKVAPAERYLVGFIFEITLGNERYARNWSVRRWVEEIIRDLAIGMSRHSFCSPLTFVA